MTDAGIDSFLSRLIHRPKYKGVHVSSIEGRIMLERTEGLSNLSLLSVHDRTIYIVPYLVSSSNPLHVMYHHTTYNDIHETVLLLTIKAKPIKIC